MTGGGAQNGAPGGADGDTEGNGGAGPAPPCGATKRAEAGDGPGRLPATLYERFRAAFHVDGLAFGKKVRELREAQAHAATVARQTEAEAQRQAEDEARHREWAAKPPEERIAGRLQFWLLGQRRKGREPTAAEVAAKRAELIANLTDQASSATLVCQQPHVAPPVKSRVAVTKPTVGVFDALPSSPEQFLGGPDPGAGGAAGQREDP